jgi:hypothetical protein
MKVCSSCNSKTQIPYGHMWCDACEDKWKASSMTIDTVMDAYKEYSEQIEEDPKLMKARTIKDYSHIELMSIPQDLLNRLTSGGIVYEHNTENIVTNKEISSSDRLIDIYSPEFLRET